MIASFSFAQVCAFYLALSQQSAANVLLYIHRKATSSMSEPSKSVACSSSCNKILKRGIHLPLCLPNIPYKRAVAVSVSNRSVIMNIIFQVSAVNYFRLLIIRYHIV
ncbi:hypothetical protein J3F84DRAFT_309761 [Trichoderma pleuroticola]